MGPRRGRGITPDLTAVRLLGGGAAYEAYLCFDEVTYAPVVVKVLRPGQVDDASGLRGLEREVDTLSRVNHPVVVRGLRAVLDGERPHVVLEALDGPRLSTLLRRSARCRSSSTSRSRSSWPRPCTTSAGSGWCTSTSSPAT